MTDWDRLCEYIHDYFPDPSYSTEDVRKWAMEKVPAWKYMSKKTRKDIITDWEIFVAPQIEKEIREKPGIWKRLRAFLGRLMGRGE